MDIDTITQILSDFRERRWDADPFGRFIGLRRADATAAAQLVQLAFDELPESGTIVDAALSFVTETEFRDLISTAVSRLSVEAGTDVADSVVAYASLQLPALLHPYVVELFELCPNQGTYYENWPWREAPNEVVSRLRSIVQTGDPSQAFKAWSCLLESRSRIALQWAIELSANLDLPHPAQIYLEHVGYQGPNQPLYSDSVMHVVFPENYFESSSPVWNEPRLHPSWQLWSEVADCRFGGAIANECGLCRKPLDNLITIPSTISPAQHDLSIVTCLSCLGWEKPLLYFQHGAETKSLDVSEHAQKPEFPAVPLKEAVVKITLTPSRWRWQDWALSNSRENLNRIGGHPCWIQSAEFPPCVICDGTMHFLLQLDSNLPTSDGGEWLWGSGGICYVFWCAKCSVSALRWQCT